MTHPTVLLGMSGGVDSSVAAALLVRQGYAVHGITLQVWEQEDETVSISKKWQERGCCKVGIAKHVAQLLNISHEVIDTRDTFRKGVIDDFLQGYTTGTTPNPCVRCNERVKIRGLMDLAASRDFNYVATGHYARLQTNHGTSVLVRATDDRKDQTYFLYRLNPHWLPRLLFPLGNLAKSEVWREAEALGLPADELKESQEICFVTQGDYRTFIEKEVPEAKKPGLFLDEAGSHWASTTELHSTHQVNAEALASPQDNGSMFNKYTRPLIPSCSARRTPCVRQECTVSDLNIFVSHLLESPTEVHVKVRYATPPTPAILSPLTASNIHVQFREPQRALSPGQSAVFYEGDHVLGGGIIQPF